MGYLNSKQSFTLVALLIGLISCNAVVAEKGVSTISFGGHDLSAYKVDSEYLVPTNRMTTAMLFEAAAAFKDPMCKEERLANMAWLIHYNRDAETGPQTLGDYLRRKLIENSDFNIRLVDVDSEFSEDTQQREHGYRYDRERSALIDIDNYRLKLSDDKLDIEFLYRFY